MNETASQTYSGDTSAEAMKLRQLLAFLDHDPTNLSLLGDTAAAALDARAPEMAVELISRAERVAPLSPALRNLHGIAFLQLNDHAQAAEIFAGLVAEGFDDPHLRFNLAWSRAVVGDHQGALDMLDDAALASSARGPSLKVQMLHHLGRLEDALALGRDLALRYPEDQALLGSLSTVAIDASDPELANEYAMRAGNSEDALATLGMLQLGDYAPEPALAFFARALEISPDQPRAWLGRGLGLMAKGDVAEAAPCLEKGAELFGHHLGSWIAAGWAHFLARDVAAARASFERALGLDDTFSEAHGGLAVVDIAGGHWDSARRRATTALRLDKQCFSGALARSLIAEHDQNPALAQKIRDRAMGFAVGPHGETLAQAVVRMGMAPATRRQ